jgi:hypothetical protein
MSQFKLLIQLTDFHRRFTSILRPKTTPAIKFWFLHVEARNYEAGATPTLFNFCLIMRRVVTDLDKHKVFCAVLLYNAKEQYGTVQVFPLDFGLKRIINKPQEPSACTLVRR